MEDEHQQEGEVGEGAAGEEGGVDRVIENAAVRANLSVLNVKSILHVS